MTVTLMTGSEELHRRCIVDMAKLAGVYISNDADVHIYTMLEPAGRIDITIFYREPGKEKRRIDIYTKVHKVCDSLATESCDNSPHEADDVLIYKPVIDGVISWKTGELVSKND